MEWLSYGLKILNEKLKTMSFAIWDLYYVRISREAYNGEGRTYFLYHFGTLQYKKGDGRTNIDCQQLYMDDKMERSVMSTVSHQIQCIACNCLTISLFFFALSPANKMDWAQQTPVLYIFLC